MLYLPFRSLGNNNGWNKKRNMEGAGGQAKRPNMPQGAPYQKCSSSPFKAGFEKRRLSLRSQNATQTGSSSSRQPIASVQKQFGKENELPFDQDIGEKKLVTFAKSESRKKKPSIPGVFADSAKRVLKRRLSGDYRDNSSSNKFCRGEIESVNRPMKIGADFPQIAKDNSRQISVYDDGGNENSERGMKGVQFSTGSAKQRFGIPDLDRRIKRHDKGAGKDVEDAKEPGERWLRKVDPAGEIQAAIKAPEAKSHRDDFPPDDNVEKLSGAGEKLVTSKSQLAGKAAQSRDSSLEKKRKFLCSNFANESSDAEFRIERVDRKDCMAPAMNNLRKFKSGSSIGRLKLTVRRGEEISPLKRRLNQYKKTVLKLGNSVDFRPGLTAASKNSEVGLNSAEGGKKLSKERSDCELESMLHLSQAKAMDKTSSEMLMEQKMNRESLIDQGKKSHRRRSSEPSVMCIGTIVADPPVSEDRHNLSPNCVDREPQIGISSSQHPLVTLSPSSPIKKSNCASRFDAEAEEIVSCERDMSLREKWDAVVAEFKNKFKPRPQVEKNSIHTVVSNEVVELTATSRTPVLYLQLSLASHSKRLAKCETKLSKSATRSRSQKGIEAQLDRATAIVVKDEPENSAEDANIDQSAQTAFKSSKTLRKIQRRDLNTMDYEEEIIKFEYARERRAHQLSKTFLKGKTVSPEQRKIVVNFLIGVHTYLSTSSSTLYQATKIFDAILDLKDVSMRELQLVALGASWIAIKNMETNIPLAREMISFAKDMYTSGGSKLLCKCEQKILKTLNFNLRFPDPFYMLSYYIEQGLALAILPGQQPTTRKIYHCAHYIVNTSLLDERYSGSSAKLLAAAAAQTAVHLVLEASENRAKWFQWHNEKITGYPQEKIDRFVKPLLVGILESAEKNSPTNAVYKKYKSSRYENISDYLITKIRSQLGFG